LVKYKSSTQMQTVTLVTEQSKDFGLFIVTNYVSSKWLHLFAYAQNDKEKKFATIKIVSPIRNVCVFTLSLSLSLCLCMCNLIYILKYVKYIKYVIIYVYVIKYVIIIHIKLYYIIMLYYYWVILLFYIIL